MQNNPNETDAKTHSEILADGIEKTLNDPNWVDTFHYSEYFGNGKIGGCAQTAGLKGVTGWNFFKISRTRSYEFAKILRMPEELLDNVNTLHCTYKLKASEIVKILRLNLIPEHRSFQKAGINNYPEAGEMAKGYETRPSGCPRVY